jgi:hypothetical protein
VAGFQSRGIHRGFGPPVDQAQTFGLREHGS